MKAVLETWRPVPGYEGLYDVSDLGAVRSHYGGKVRYLKCHKAENGYIQVALYKNGKGKGLLVHRIEWEAFHCPIPDGMQIDHINTIRDDNRLSNLRVVTSKENSNNSITAERMRESAKRRSESQDWQKKNREAAQRRQQNPEWREKMREAAKKRSGNQEWRNNIRDAVRRVFAKPIVQLDKKTDKVIRRWECMADAAREFGIRYGNISACCRGKRKSAYGFRWRYADDD